MRNPTDRPGALIIIGGGGTPPEVHEEFFRLAGDKAARVIHIPSATSTFEEIENKREYYCEFYDREPASFDFLHTNERAEAEQPDFARPLETATGVWIGGGNQNRLSSLFVGTNVIPAIQGVVARGGVVGGTSSGASIMSDVMISYGYTEASLDKGFGLYPGAIVDPHFTARAREHRLAHGVMHNRGFVGIGVDEKCALIVRGNVLRVIGIGSGCVWFYFAERRSRRIKHYHLAIGESVELATPVIGASLPTLQSALRALRPGVIVPMSDLFREEAIA
jgi:cyanophycinase